MGTNDRGALGARKAKLEVMGLDLDIVEILRVELENSSTEDEELKALRALLDEA